MFLLSAGKWYAVAKDFVSEINEAVRALVTGSMTLPEYDDDTETTYNKRVAMADARFAHMDRKNIRYGGGPSAIEFCDLFRDDRKLVHVKRYGGSAPLSHHFSQGEVDPIRWTGWLRCLLHGMDQLELGRAVVVDRRVPALEIVEVVDVLAN